MPFLLFVFLPCFLLFGTVSQMATLEKAFYSASVGEPLTMRFLLPPNTISLEALRASMIYNPFFSKERGMAQLLSVTQEGSFLQVSFVPKAVGGGLCFFAPVLTEGKILNWPMWHYSFSLPMPPTFSYPLLDMSFNPIIPSSHPLLLQETQAALQGQQDRFESREEMRLLFWQSVLVITLFILSFPFLKQTYSTWKARWIAYTAKRELLRQLNEAVRDKRPVWGLLLHQLVRLQGQEVRKETALDLALFFQENKQEDLSQAAFLIERYGYLADGHFDKFLESYQKVIDHLLKKENR
jgi:hypothetical protein